MCKSSHEVQVVFVNSLIIGYIIPARLMEVPKNNKVYECHPRELERAQHVADIYSSSVVKGFTKSCLVPRSKPGMITDLCY